MFGPKLNFESFRWQQKEKEAANLAVQNNKHLKNLKKRKKIKIKSILLPKKKKKKL